MISQRCGMMKQAFYMHIEQTTALFIKTRIYAFSLYLLHEDISYKRYAAIYLKLFNTVTQGQGCDAVFSREQVVDRWQ